MEKIGDYIPLIIIALSFIYSFARKAGKKEVSQTQGENKKQPEVAKTPSKYQWSFLETVQDNGFQPDSFLDTAHNKKIVKTNEERKPVFIEEITDDSGISLDFSNMEELKKGIIYAEIFNRNEIKSSAF